MKKFNLFLLLLILSVPVAMAQYSQVSSLTCFPSPAGTSISTSFTGLPSPAGDGTITLLYQGDIDNSSEYLTLYGENNTLIGPTIPSGVFADQCKGTLDSISFTVTVSQLVSWMANGSVDFTVTPQSAVSTTLCTPCSGAQIRISYPSVTGPDDAGIAGIGIGSGSVFCSGTQAVTATLTNAGTNQITTAIVGWELNGVAQTPVNFTGLLDTLGGTGSQMSVVNLGSVNFSPGTTTIKVYSSMPNGVADTSNLNDTTSRSAGPSLSGTFTVNSSSPTSGTNFSSFGDLSGALSSFGVCGPVTVNVASGTYNDNILLGQIQGASATNSITIDGGDSSLTIIDGSSGFYSLAFVGSEYFTVRNMGFVNNRSSCQAVIFGANSSNNIVENCEIKVLTTSTSTVVNPIGASNSLTTRATNAPGVDSNTVQNNRIVGGYYGVYFYGGNGNLQLGNKVLNNQIDSVYYYGVYGYYADQMEISGNVMDLTTRNNIQADGIYGLYNTNGIFVGNKIHAPDYGFYISNSSTLAGPTIRKTIIANNMITSDSDFGLYLNAVNLVNIYHNSIVTNGPAATSSPAVYLLASTTYPIGNYDVRNNIFYATMSEAFETGTAVPDTIFNKLDNNIYYTGGATTFRIAGSNYSDLTAYQAANTIFNTASLQGDPSFFSLNDLHIAGALANDAGDNSVGILTDIDGDARPFAGSTVVDIGADEYSPPTCPPPTTLSSYGSTSSSAIINWIGTLGNSYQYDVVAGGAGQGSASIQTAIIAVDTALITGLNPYTIYDFYVRQICGRGDSSSWVGPVSFRTLCAPFSAPYSNGFETDAINAGPGCWSEYVSYSSTSVNIWVRALGGTAAPYSGSQALYIYPGSGFVTGDTLAALSPSFSDMSAGDKQVRFFANADDILNNQLIVGTTDGIGSFTALDTIVFAQNDVYQEVIVPITTLNGYNGTDNQIALVHSIPSTLANFDYIRVDDFNYELMPACPKPQGLGVNNLTANSVDLLWTSPSGGNSFQVEYGAVNFVQGSGTLTASATTSLSLSGLPAASGYHFYVREFCTATDTSVWNGPFAFNTLIQGPVGVNCITGNPSVVFSEEFDAIGGWTGDVNSGTTAGDWNFGHANGTSSSLTGPLSAYSGNNYVYVEASGSAGSPWGTHAIIVSPAIDLTNVSDSAELSFWMHAFGQTMGDLTVGVGTSASGPFIPVFSWLGDLQAAQGDPWQNIGARLDAYVGQTIYLELDFLIGSGFYSDIGIDLLEISSCISCATPTALVDSNLNAFDVDLAWGQAGTVLGWELERGPANFTLGTGTRIPVTTLPVNITGLTPATSYDWYVRAICTVGDTSVWTSNSFKTPCAPFTSPHYNGFESGPINTTPDCWTEYLTYTGASANVWTRSLGGTAAPYAGSQAMYIYPQSGFVSGSDTIAAISPQFTDMIAGNKRLRFWANVDDVANNELIVGTVDGQGSFTALDTLTFAANDVYQEFTVNITAANGYNGTDLQVYLAHSLRSTLANFDYIRVDDFRYEDIPSCVRPSNLNSSNSTLSTVDVDWVENNSATNWEISYVTPGQAPGTGTQSIVTAKPHTITGMPASTSFEFYVRSICTPGSDTSFWEGPIVISTANGIPYFQDFTTFGINTGAVNSLGWSNYSASNPKFQSGSSTSSTATGPAADHTTGPGGIFMYLETSSSTNGNRDTLYSPPIFVNSTIDTLEYEYWYHMYGVNINELQTYLEVGSTLIPVNTILGQQQTTQAGAWLPSTNTVAINPGPNGSAVRMVFVGVAGTSFNGDISIDDVALRDQLTSISKTIKSIEGLSIYPNPSNGVFVLTLNNPKVKLFNLNVMDLSGKKVFEEVVSMNRNIGKQIDLSNLAKGVYFLHVQSGNESKVEKLIIR